MTCGTEMVDISSQSVLTPVCTSQVHPGRLYDLDSYQIDVEAFDSTTIGDYLNTGPDAD
jgi:hypothetical protein